MQRCSHCRRALALDLFPPSQRGRIGAWCRDCNRAAYLAKCGGLTWRECRWCHSRKEVTASRASVTNFFCTRKCKDEARRAEERHARAVANVMLGRVCPICGGLLGNARSDAVFCTEKCNSTAHRRKRRRKTIAYLANRDGWRCQLCGKVINPRRKSPDLMSASVDHIVPSACGGTDEMANLWLAHLRCNLSKRDRPRSEQLRMIG